MHLIQLFAQFQPFEIFNVFYYLFCSNSIEPHRVYVHLDWLSFNFSLRNASAKLKMLCRASLRLLIIQLVLLFCGSVIL